MNRGIILFNRGTKCIVRLIVAIRSLRKHYDGPIAAFLEGEDAESLGDSLQARFGVIPIFDKSPTGSSLIRKIEISPKSPFDNTVYLDADTLTVGKLDELFEAAPNYDFIGTNFAGWRSDGNKVGGRTRSFKGICSDEYIEKALKYGPAINTGIYAFRKGSPIFREWLELARKGDETKKMQIPDEIACQILAPQYNTWVAPCKFNVSVVYDPDTPDRRVIHYHGRKHCLGYPLCRLWVAEFTEALQENCCDIARYTHRRYGDRRLNAFLNGQSGPVDLLPPIREALKLPPIVVASPAGPVLATSPDIKVAPLEPRNDVTIVTAVDRKYLSHLRLSFANWLHYKGLGCFPFLVYINGFDNLRDEELAFLWSHDNVTLKAWNFPLAESQRENMLTAYVLGAAKDVTTPFWLKLDADAFAIDTRELINEEMKKYVFCGHRWHYTKPGTWIQVLDQWAETLAVKFPKPPLFDPTKLDGRRYYHPRTASYVQLHQADFVRQAAALAGERLPVPSHDTYLFYVAERLGLPFYRHNFKRCTGMTNFTHLADMQKAAEQLRTKGKVE